MLLSRILGNQLMDISCFPSQGRAWLYIALNEQAMESYIRMFIENQDIAQDYYLRYVQYVG